MSSHQVIEIVLHPTPECWAFVIGLGIFAISHEVRGWLRK